MKKTALVVLGILLIEIPLHYVGFKLSIVGEVFRDDPWPWVSKMLTSTRFVLPLWLYWVAFTFGGACLIHLGVRRESRLLTR